MKRVKILILIFCCLPTILLGQVGENEQLIVSGTLYGLSNGEASVSSPKGEVICRGDIVQGKFKLEAGTIKPGEYILQLGNSSDKFFFGNESIKISGYLDPESPDFEQLQIEGDLLGQKVQEYVAEVEAFKNHFMNDYRAKYKKGPTPEEEEVLIYSYDNLEQSIAKEVIKLMKDENCADVKAYLAYTFRGKYYETASLLYGNLSEKGKASTFGKLLSDELQNKLIKMANGQPAPSFSLLDDKGKKCELDDLKGKVLVLDFWASWCTPCRNELKYLKKIYAEFDKTQVEFVSISVDDHQDKWLKALEEEQIPWLNLWNAEGLRNSSLASDYNFNTIPYIVVIDKEGRIAGKMVRRNALVELIKSKIEK